MQKYRERSYWRNIPSSVRKNKIIKTTTKIEKVLIEPHNNKTTQLYNVMTGIILSHPVIWIRPVWYPLVPNNRMAVTSWKVTNDIRCRNRKINSGTFTVGKYIPGRYIQDDHIGIWSLWLGENCTLNVNVLPDLYQMQGEKQATIVCSTGQMIQILSFWNSSKCKIGEVRCLQETRTYYLHLPHYIWEGFQRGEI